MAHPAVELQRVSKTYHEGDFERAVLRDVSVAIEPGEIAVLIGRSGSGKSTLLNLIAGIDRPTAGRVLVDGTDLTGLDEDSRTRFRRRRIGFVFQFFNLVPTLTALENVQLVAELVGKSDPDASATLHLVGLDARADHFPAALSGGEQQRVAIARALVKDPPLLLCDEPTGSLDLEIGRQVLAVLHRLSREGGRTVLLVTHNAAIATIADRVVRMRSGEIVEDRLNSSPSAPDGISW
jgi:putative ABC transport system ATP-binding protein